MSNNNFIRKVIYIIAIGVLLIPLSLVSRPASKGTKSDAGGQLAQLRDTHELSQSQLMEIDPASETMKLASLGLRGIAVNMLWMQAIEHKKKENYNQLASTLKALTKIQPNFVKVWEYQGHNMSYNISMEFDDYEMRYHWVKKGIGFLKEGIPYNRRDHRMLDHLGFFTGMKIGRSDEKVQFRRMFREDNDFHESMSDKIDPDKYDTRDFGHDNWKMAYNWYDMSNRMVEEESAPQYTSDARFFMFAPAQLRNQGLSLNNEFRPGQIHQDIWQQAADEWVDYGNKEIRNTFGVTITMDGVSSYEERLIQLEKELDELGPQGYREERMKAIYEKIQLSEMEQEALDTPPSERTDEQFFIAMGAQGKIAKEDTGINLEIANNTSEENKRKAFAKFDEIAEAKTQIGVVGTHDSVTNYRYWKRRNRAEADELLLLARQSLFDAEELARKSILDDEYSFNYVTKEKKIIRRGAISKYEEAFRRFDEVIDSYVALRSGELADSLIDSLKQYQRLLKIAGKSWPEKDFPIQELIDKRAAGGEFDNLPTTEALEEARTAREELEELQDEDGSNDEMKEEAKKDEAKKDEAKKDEAKKDEAKKDEAKKDEAKKDEAKKDEAKKDEAKKDEAKKDEAKKDEAKKDEAKKDEAKKDEAKKDEAKKDEADNA